MLIKFVRKSLYFNWDLVNFKNFKNLELWKLLFQKKYERSSLKEISWALWFAETEQA